MAPSKSSILPGVACAAIGGALAFLAAYSAPGRWSLLAAAGAAMATTGLLVISTRFANELAAVEGREQQLQAAVSASETRITALVARVRDAATHDDVTGTLNRRAFIAHLEEVLQRDARLQKPMAFLLVDIDDFKKINADGGRIIGDRVLVSVARAIQASTRGTDFIGRIGGDELAVVLGECVDPNPAVDRIFVALHGETPGGATPLPIRVSVGTVTIPEPQSGVEMVPLFQLAEEALTSARNAGGGRCATREYPVEKSSPLGVR